MERMQSSEEQAAAAVVAVMASFPRLTRVSLSLSSSALPNTLCRVDTMAGLEGCKCVQQEKSHAGATITCGDSLYGSQANAFPLAQMRGAQSELVLLGGKQVHVAMAPGWSKGGGFKCVTQRSPNRPCLRGPAGKGWATRAGRT